MLQIKNRAILDQWKLLSIVKGWSTLEATEKDIWHDLTPIDSSARSGDESGDTVKTWIGRLVDRLIDRSVETSENNKSGKSYETLLSELTIKANELYEEWSNIKVKHLISHNKTTKIYKLYK